MNRPLVKQPRRLVRKEAIASMKLRGRASASCLARSRVKQEPVWKFARGRRDTDHAEIELVSAVCCRREQLADTRVPLLSREGKATILDTRLA